MLEKKIEASISKNNLDFIYTGAILGFSGGADSSALLHFLKSRTKNLLCVHINHMIRGEEADRDEAQAKCLCQEYGAKFLSFKIDVPGLAKERKQGLEETARNERYRIFGELLLKNPEYKCIVTAHNSDDNAETVLFNLARGTGTQGLIGIKPVQGNIVRPMLDVSKKEILEYCEKNKINYVTDSTNSDTKYTRNHIRHNILPEMEKINPDFLSACHRLGDILANDEEYFKLVVDKIIKDNKIENKIELTLLNTQPRSIATRLLRTIHKGELDYNASIACIELAKKAECGSLINLLGGYSFKIERTYAHFIKTEETKNINYDIALKDGENYIDVIDAVILVNSNIVPNGYYVVNELSFDKSKLCDTLHARSRREGDTIKSGKMTKKLKKLFLEKGILSHQRGKLPIITMKNEIICVPGVAMRDGVKGNDFIIKICKRGS